MSDDAFTGYEYRSLIIWLSDEKISNKAKLRLFFKLCGSGEMTGKCMLLY